MAASAPPSEKVYLSSLPGDLDDAKLTVIFGAYGNIKETKMLPNGCAIVTFGSVQEAQWIVDNLDGNMPEGITSPVSVKFANPPRSWGKSGSWGSDRFGPYSKGDKGGSWDKGGGWDKGGSWDKGGDSWGKGGGWGKGDGPSVQVLKKTLLSMGVLPGGKGSKDRSDAQQVYIKGLPMDTTDMDLYDIFGCFGAICSKGVKAMLSDDGSCTGIAFVDFVHEQSAAQAVEVLDGTELVDGSILRLSVKNSGKGASTGKGWGESAKGWSDSGKGGWSKPGNSDNGWSNPGKGWW